MDSFGHIGMAGALCFSAIGSAFGTSAAGMAALGAWKKCHLANKPAPFILIAFAGAPLTQVIYGMILMNSLKESIGAINDLSIVFAGIFGGLAIGASSWGQGKAAAAASDAFATTGKGFANNLMVLGIIETVALFVMVFLMTAI